MLHFSTAGFSKNKDAFEEPDPADEARLSTAQLSTGHHGVIDSQSSFFPFKNWSTWPFGQVQIHADAAWCCIFRETQIPSSDICDMIAVYHCWFSKPLKK